MDCQPYSQRGRYVLALILLVMLTACAGKTPTATIVPTVYRSPSPSATPGASPPTLTPTFSPIPPTPTPIPPTPSSTMTMTPVPPTPTPTETPTPACVETHGRIVTDVFFSALINQVRPYRVYLPPCYDVGDEVYPVLYMLHGYPFDDSHWDDLGIDEAADAGIADDTLPPFVIAMPSADNEGTYTNTSGGPGSFEALLLDDFVPFIEANYRVSSLAQGRAIGGMSRGGVWSLEIAFHNPDFFAAVGGHSVALSVNLAPPVYDPLYLAADPAIRSLRIYLDVGQDDWTRPSMDDLHNKLNDSAVAHDYYVYEGSHTDAYWAAHLQEYLLFYTAGW